ncbi:hypothetical protein BH09PLA1_BH09PLA1_30330 [soil metagenome]
MRCDATETTGGFANFSQVSEHLGMTIPDGPPSLPPPRRASWFISWLMILGSIGYLAGQVYTHKQAAAGRSDDFQLELTGRILVGQKLTLETLAQKQPSVRESMRSIDAGEKSLQQKLRLAIVAGELAGAEEAMKRVGELRSSAATRPQIDDLQTLEKIYAGQRDLVTPDERTTLVEHHDWFGRLALVYGLPDDNTERAAVIAPAKRAMLVSALAVGGILMLVLAGLILLIVAIVLLANRTIRPRFSPVVTSSGTPVFLEAFAIYITLFVLFGELTRVMMHTPSLVRYLFFTLLIPAALAWPILRGASWRESMLGFGWHRGRGLFTEMGCGIGGYIAGLPLVALALLVTVLLSRFVGASPSHPITNELRGSRATLGLIYVLACVWAPLMEETMFRGALFNHLRGRWNWIVSALVVGLLFALVHPQGWTAIPALGTIGAVLAGLREWRGSLIGPMTAHALNNATAITIAALLVR